MRQATIPFRTILVLVAAALVASCADEGPVGVGGSNSGPLAWRSESPVPPSLSLDGIWGTSPDRIFCVGGTGTILQFDGSDWSRTQPNAGAALRAVWGASDDDIFAVGPGTILRFDGTSWSPMEGGSAENLGAVFGTSASDVFASSSGGRVLHFDGTKWNSVLVDSLAHLYDLWGRAPGDFYAVGSRYDPDVPGTVPAVYHYDGALWSLLGSEGIQASFLQAVWGVGTNDLFVAGLGGVSHFDGTNWNVVGAGGPNGVADLWASSVSNLFAIDSKGLWRSDGSAWTLVHDSRGGGVPTQMRSLWGDGAGRVYVAASRGALYRYDSGGTELLNQSIATIYDIWGSSERDIYAVGEAGSMLHYNGAWWTRVQGTWDRDFTGVDGSAPNNVYAVDGWIHRFDGSYWSQMTVPAQSGAITGVWVAPSEKVFFWGRNGVWIFADGNWESFAMSIAIEDMWGTSEADVYAVSGQTILHYDGRAWEVMPGVPGVYLSCIFGFGRNEVYAAGSTVIRLVAGTWQRVPDAPALAANAMWGTSGRDLFIAGRTGIHHFNGSWTTTDLEPGIQALAVWGSSPRNVLAGGTLGMLLRYSQGSQ